MYSLLHQNFHNNSYCNITFLDIYTKLFSCHNYNKIETPRFYQIKMEYIKEDKFVDLENYIIVPLKGYSEYNKKQFQNNKKIKFSNFVKVYSY